MQLSTDGEAFRATLDVSAANCAIDLYFSDEFAQRHAGTLLAGAGGAARDVVAEIGPQWRVKPSSGLSIRNFSYPRPRPARTPLVVDGGMLVDVVDERTHTSPEEAKAVRQLREAALPKGAERTVSGTRIVLEWAAGAKLNDVETIRRRLTERERWLGEHAGAAPDPNWNDAGDVKSGVAGGTPRPPLTLYSAPLEVGYKAIHGAAPAAEIDAALEQVAGWISAGRVDEQTPVADVVIIADSRESAVALRPRMEKAGVPHVVYPDEDGTLWDPFPQGEWADDR